MPSINQSILIALLVVIVFAGSLYGCPRYTVYQQRLTGRFESMIKNLGDKITVLMWAVGINAAATITMLVKHW